MYKSLPPSSIRARIPFPSQVTNTWWSSWLVYCGPLGVQWFKT